jgi:hypothetical protein
MRWLGMLHRDLSLRSHRSLHIGQHAVEVASCWSAFPPEWPLSDVSWTQYTCLRRDTGSPSLRRVAVVEGPLSSKNARYLSHHILPCLIRV